MKKRLINLCLVFVFIGAIYIFVNKYEYADSLKPKAYLQTALGIDITLPLKENNIVEMKTSELKENNELQQYYGTYEIIEFWSTIYFYRGLKYDDIREQEADMMIGREIVVNEQLFTTYDNGRLPNSEAVNRLMDDYLLEKIEITTPDYQIERKLRDDIFGLRDDMMPEEMQQEEYIEINVYPGYGESIFDRVLPQMYLLNDGRILLYAMGEYFLLEKNGDI